MKNRITASALVAAAALAVCSPAAAASVTVNLRIEGANSTVLEQQAITTDTRTVPVGECNGGSVTREIPGATALGVLDDGAHTGGFSYDGASFGPGPGDVYVCRIGSDSGSNSSFWLYKVNNALPSVGAGVYTLTPGDRVLWYFTSDFSAKTLDLSGPGRVATGALVPVEARAYDENGAGSGADGATIAAAGPGGSVQSATADADGKATLSFASPGLYSLKATHSGAIRSNALAVCASASGTGDCGAPASQLGNISAPGPVHDSKAPVALISGPRDGGHYRRGPRLLRGTARDEVDVSVVKLALRRHVRGHCRWWSGRRERFVGSNCHKKFFFGIGADASWSYLLPKPLSPGRYVLDVKAFDRARNRDERFTRGSDRIVFEVAGRGRATGARAARGRGAGVRVLVDGRDRTLAGPQLVRPRAARLAVGGRRCAVGAATPLAALAAVLRSSRVGYHLRDFGRCSARRAADSAQLFVDRIGPDANAGADGWVYKVGRRAGTAGSADPSGPFGSGRLQGGERLLWFYCLLNERVGSCQRTLELRPGRPGGRSGQRLRVRVRAYDDDGRGRAQEGAAVSLGPASATTGASGKTELTLPAAGRYLLRASAPGTVAAFPVAVKVGRAR